jgi:hypothetical protein
MITTNIPDYTELLHEHFDNIVEFLQSPEVLKLYPKPKKVNDTDWADIERQVIENHGPVHPLYGKCFYGAKFALYFGGGRDWFDLKLIKPFEFCSSGFKTTHWFIKDKTGKIIDPTAGQFCYEGYEYNKDQHMIDRWNNAKNGDFGFKYFHSHKHLKFDQVVPSKFVIELGKLYKEMNGGIECGFDYWIETIDNLENERLV